MSALDTISANALTSLGAARAWCLRDEQDGSRDQLLTLAINGVSSQIIRYCGREFFPTDDEARIFSYDGSGYLSFEPFELRAFTEIRARYVGYPTWTTLNDAGTIDVMLRPQPMTPEGTFLYMVAPEYVNPTGFPERLARGLGIEVEITGDWGMEAIPADAEMATLIAVDWRYKNPSGAQSVNVGDLGQDSFYSTPPPGSGVPALPGEVISMLEQFRRSQYGV